MSKETKELAQGFGGRYKRARHKSAGYDVIIHWNYMRVTFQE